MLLLNIATVGKMDEIQSLDIFFSSCRLARHCVRGSGPAIALCSQVGASLGMQTKRDNIEILAQGMTERTLVTENKASCVSSLIEQFIY